MIKKLLIFMLCSMPSAWAAPAYVQSNSDRINDTSVGVAFTSNNTAGNLIVAVGKLSTSTTMSISDSQSNTYTADVNAFDCGSVRSYVWSAPNIASGANTVTFTLGAAGKGEVAIHEYSGTDTSSVLDVTSTNCNTAATSHTSGSATTTEADEVIFGFIACGGKVAITAGTGYTIREKQGADRMGTEDKIVSSTGSHAATFTTDVSEDCGVSMATYQKTSAAGARRTMVIQ